MDKFTSAYKTFPITGNDTIWNFNESFKVVKLTAEKEYKQHLFSIRKGAIDKMVEFILDSRHFTDADQGRLDQVFEGTGWGYRKDLGSYYNT